MYIIKEVQIRLMNSCDTEVLIRNAQSVSFQKKRTILKVFCLQEYHNEVFVNDGLP